MGGYKGIIITTSRADYGLLYPLIKRLMEDGCFEVEVAATGSHLSRTQGYTIDYILNDGIKVSHVVDMTVEGDSEASICRAVSIGLRGFSEIFEKSKPDFIIVLGDRYELVSVCNAAVIHKIPIVHIHGGEATFGAIDDSIRHSVTKMSAIHFPSIDIYRNRIIQMGESPEKVFSVGALGIDNIMGIDYMSRAELSEYAGVDFNRAIALLTYHPVTLDQYSMASNQIKEVLDALLETKLYTIVTMPNVDAGGGQIFEVLSSYTSKYQNRFKLVKSLGQRAYLSAMKYAELMIGNSSSGIIESASFRLPVVNIGDRQAGRLKPQNIIDCQCSREDISQAIGQALSDSFKAAIEKLVNPYGQGDTAERISSILKNIDFSNKEILLKKGFYDILNSNT